jgi:hypothetical protein
MVAKLRSALLWGTIVGAVALTSSSSQAQAPDDPDRFVAAVCSLFKGTSRAESCARSEGPTIKYILAYSQKRGIDPFTAATVPFQESSYRRVLGDGGYACGMGQIHARWEIKRKDDEGAVAFADRVGGVCVKLMTDDQYTVRVIVRRLIFARDKDPAKDPVVKQIWRYKLPFGDPDEKASRVYFRRHNKIRSRIVAAYGND